MLKKCCSNCNRELIMNEYHFKSNPKSKDGFNKKCKECSTGKKIFTQDGYKICKECQENLRMNTDYYYVKKGTYDGFTNKCKKCSGFDYTDLLTRVTKEGYKSCIRCDAELKVSPAYFPIDNTCKDGYRNVCRKCGKDGKYFDESYEPSFNWSNDENELFITRYPHYLNSELIEIFYPNMTEKQLWDRANRLDVVKSEETTKRRYRLHSEKMYGVDSPIYGLKRSDETRQKLKEVSKNRRFNIGDYVRGRVRPEEERLYTSKIMSSLGLWRGNKNPNWHGGTSTETKKARNSQEYRNWRRDVLIRDDNCCQRCGSNEKLEAHHIKPFNVDKSLRYEVDNGITLCEKCHSVKHKGSFHNVYGTYRNTKEQLEEYFTGIYWDVSTMKLSTDKSFLFGKMVIFND